MKTNYQELNTTEILESFKLFVSNQKKVDKFSLCYYLRMLDHRYHFAEYNTRKEINKIFLSIITVDNMHRCICSEWTKNQIVETYNRKLISK